MPAIANSGLPLPYQLKLLRLLAKIYWRRSAIDTWAKSHPQINLASNWGPRAWWGVAAGGLVRKYLDNPLKRKTAIALLEPVDWSEIDNAIAAGGVIIATAHLGPPKFLMHALLAKELPLLVWTNKFDLPSWIEQSHNAKFLNPLISDERSLLMIKSAIHLRQGGVLLGAADVNTGNRIFEILKFDQKWQLSPGLPALARLLSVPTFLVLALWQGNKIKIQFQKLDFSGQNLNSEQWQDEWLHLYWNELEKIISTSPENLRFLRNIDEGRFIKSLGI